MKVAPVGRLRPGAIARRAAAQSERSNTPDEDSAKPGSSGLAPGLFYILVEFSRPVAWIAPLAAIRPGVLAALWGIGAVVSGDRRPMPRGVRYILIFLAVMAWNIPWAVNNRYAYNGFRDFALMVVGGVLPLALLPRGLSGVRRLFSAYVILHIPAAIHGLLYSGRGPGGWMGDENDLALALNVAIAIAVYLLMETTSRPWKLVYMAAIGTMVSAVVASNSRGGFVGLLIVGVYLIIFGPHRKAIGVLALTAVIGLLAFAPASYWDEVSSIASAAEVGDTGEKRLYYWGIAWDMFLDHPITGVGTTNYGVRAPEYQDPNRVGWKTHMWGRVAHSLYFTVLPEQGIIGTFVFFAMIFWTYKIQMRLRDDWLESDDPDARTAALIGSGGTAGIFAVLATGAFVSVLYYPPLWILVAMMAALDGVVQEARQ